MKYTVSLQVSGLTAFHALKEAQLKINDSLLIFGADVFPSISIVKSYATLVPPLSLKIIVAKRIT